MWKNLIVLAEDWNIREESLEGSRSRTSISKIPSTEEKLGEVVVVG